MDFVLVEDAVAVRVALPNNASHVDVVMDSVIVLPHQSVGVLSGYDAVAVLVNLRPCPPACTEIDSSRVIVATQISAARSHMTLQGSGSQQ